MVDFLPDPDAPLDHVEVSANGEIVYGYRISEDSDIEVVAATSVTAVRVAPKDGITGPMLGVIFHYGDRQLTYPIGIPVELLPRLQQMIGEAYTHLMEHEYE